MLEMNALNISQKDIICWFPSISRLQSAEQVRPWKESLTLSHILPPLKLYTKTLYNFFNFSSFIQSTHFLSCTEAAIKGAYLHSGVWYVCAAKSYIVVRTRRQVLHFKLQFQTLPITFLNNIIASWMLQVLLQGEDSKNEKKVSKNQNTCLIFTFQTTTQTPRILILLNEMFFFV